MIATIEETLQKKISKTWYQTEAKKIDIAKYRSLPYVGELALVKNNACCNLCPLKDRPFVLSTLPFNEGKSVWIIGGTPTYKDLDRKKLFMSSGGIFFRRLLKETGFYKDAKNVLFTNACLCIPQKDVPQLAIDLCRWHFEELQKKYPPSLCIALGSVASRSLGLKGNIESLRQTFQTCQYGDGKVIVTYSPESYGFSNVKLQQSLLLDIKKAISFLKSNTHETIDSYQNIYVFTDESEILASLERLLTVKSPVSMDLETSILLSKDEKKSFWLVDGLKSTDIYSFSFAYDDMCFVFPYEGAETIESVLIEERKKYLRVFGKEFDKTSLFEYKNYCKLLDTKKAKDEDTVRFSPAEMKKLEKLLEIYQKVERSKDSINQMLKTLSKSDVFFIGHNVLFDKKKVSKIADFKFSADTMVLAYLINENLKGYYSLDALVNIFVPELKDYKNLSVREDFFVYSGYDAIATLILYKRLLQIIPYHQEQQIKKALNFIMDNVLPVVSSIDCTGIKIDREKLQLFSKKIATIKEKVLDRIETITSQRNTKTKKFKEILGQLYEYDCKMTKNNEISVNEDSLREMYHKTGNPTLKELILCKKTVDTLDLIDKQYIQKILSFAEPLTDRIYPKYKITGSETGRVTTSDPPLQNFPKHGVLLCSKCNLILMDENSSRCDICGNSKFISEFNIKDTLVPDENNVLFFADYSQIEIAVLAELSGDENLINIINQKLDFHSYTASKLFGIPYDEIVKNKHKVFYDQKRQIAKSVVFGVIYGQTPYGLAKSIGISYEEAENMIKDFYAKFPKTKHFMDECIRTVRKLGYISTPTGRIRRFPVIDNHAIREIINFPIQSYAADIVHASAKILMNALKKYNAKIVGLISDSIIIESPVDVANKVENLIRYYTTQKIKNIFKLKVNLSISISKKETSLSS